MRDIELYRRILGIENPWVVINVELDRTEGEVRIELENTSDRLACPKCGVEGTRYDAKVRHWQHLDTCQFRTILMAMVPRVDCTACGALQVRVPWAEPGSHFTALMEALIIDWLKEASTAAVARQMKLSWSRVDGVMQRAVARGLARRERRLPAHLGVDETSFQKRHEYVTVVSDQAGSVVEHVGDGRKQETLEGYLSSFTAVERAQVESVAMDMWPPYIAAVEATIPEAGSKIAFDRFHVAAHLGKAVDEVRKAENKALRQAGNDALVGSKHLWLQNPEAMSDVRWAAFEPLRTSDLRTARAWAIRELAAKLWRRRSRGWARRAWLRWYSWAIRSRLEPVRRVARMIKKHLEGILNAIAMGVTNARAEGVNAKIQWLKYLCRGFRNRERFRTAIYFHLGGLDLYPAPATHSQS